METGKNSNIISKEKKKVRRPYRRDGFSAQEKSRAVLMVWMERKKPADICREMEISWGILNQWQDRAIEGMMGALSPRVSLEKSPDLSTRLQALLEKKAGQMRRSDVKAVAEKLDERMARIAEKKEGA